VTTTFKHVKFVTVKQITYVEIVSLLHIVQLNTELLIGKLIRSNVKSCKETMKAFNKKKRINKGPFIENNTFKTIATKSTTIA
jgi:hypothetical protein